MMYVPETRAGRMSAGVFVAASLCILGGVVETFRTASDRYWPLIVFGLVFTCASAPFYYYYKDRERRVPMSHAAAIDALAMAGKIAHDEKQQPQTPPLPPAGNGQTPPRKPQ